MLKTFYVNPFTYRGPGPISDYVAAVAEIYGLDPTQALQYVKNLPPLESFVPADVVQYTGWFAVPSDKAIIKLFPDVFDKAERYCRMLMLIQQKIADSRSFSNSHNGEIDIRHLRQLRHTSEMLAKAAEAQKGDILMIAAQLGKPHCNLSVRQARERFVSNEFGLCPVIGGTIMLACPEQFADGGELNLGCTSGEWSSNADDVFESILDFYVGAGGVELITYEIEHAYQYVSSASAFLQK